MKAKILLLLALLALLASGCRGTGSSPVLPSRPVETSDELAEQARQKLEAIRAGGSFSLTFTEGEATSLLISFIEERLKESPLQEPVIWFEKDRIIARGKVVNVMPITLEFVVVLSPYLKDGLPQIKFNYLEINGWQAPRALLRLLSRSANETLAEAGPKVHLKELSVQEGSITLSGRFTE